MFRDASMRNHHPLFRTANATIMWLTMNHLSLNKLTSALISSCVRFPFVSFGEKILRRNVTRDSAIELSANYVHSRTYESPYKCINVGGTRSVTLNRQIAVPLRGIDSCH